MTQANRLPAMSALRAFESVARLGSLSTAAAELNVTKSAISHQLRALEADLGVSLLNRGGTLRRATVTDAGAELQVSVQQALAILEDSCRRLRSTAQEPTRHVLNISSNASLAALWLAPRIGRFVELHPDIDVRVFLHAVHDPAWKAQSIDLAFLHMRNSGPFAAQPGDIPFVQETVIPVCSPSLLAAADPDDPAFLLRHRWLQEKHVDSPETDWKTWRTHLDLDHLPTPDVLTLSGLSTVVAAAAAGVGIALGRSPLVDEEINRGHLVALVPQRRLPGSWGYVMRFHPNRPMDHCLPALVEFLLEEGKANWPT